MFLLGFRVGLNVQASNVIDVGYSGVVGAQRIATGQSPYGHFPTDDGRPCGDSRDASEPRDFLQTNGRCEASNGRGDTYGPVAYEAYLPGYALFGWDGRWEGATGARHLPAVHFTTLFWDALCLIGLVLVGWRFGGLRMAAVLAFAWAAYPFTQYASSSNTNDSIMPAFLLFGFWLLTVPAARGAFLALAGWTKFAALLLVPLWWRYGRDGGRPARRDLAAFAAGFAVATVAAFSVLILEPSPLHAARVFAERTVGWQIGRESPFSLWGWGQYHAAGIPDLGWLQRILEVGLLGAALALAWVPRRLTPLRLAALTGAVILGFEIVLTHWFYLYIPWFFPFVAIALLAPAAQPAAAPARSESRAPEARELVAAS